MKNEGVTVPKFDLSDLERQLPAIFGRSEIRRLLGGVLSPGYLANFV